MRKARFKMMLVAAIAAFALLFAGMERAQAQTDMDDPFALPTDNFVSAVQAQQLLAAQVASLKDFIVTLVQGTAAYKTAERAIFYYSTIQGEVGSGKDIPNSIVTGLTYVIQSNTGTTSMGTNNGPDGVELWDLRNDAIDLLSQ